jgi:hypothetical protein
MAAEPLPLTQSRLKELLHYDPETGVFRWKTREDSPFSRPGITASWNTKYAGKIAGVSTEGRVKISIDGRQEYAHRLAWLYVHGGIPSDTIVPKNGAIADTRLENLMPATVSEHHRLFPVRRDNLTGYKGVTPSRGRFAARIRINGRHTHIGVYDSAAEAHAAYLSRAAERDQARLS